MTAEGASPAASRSGIDAWRLAHLSVLVVGLVTLTALGRGQWFFGDEWDFLTDRGLIDAPRGLFEPHNEHWSTLPILVYRGLFSLFGLHTYVPYHVIVVLAHLAAAHLLWRLQRRAGVDAMVATMGTAVFVFFGGGSENLLWAFQMGFVGSLALGLWVVDLLDGHAVSRRRLMTCSAIAVVSLPISGISVLMVAVAALLLVLRRRWLNAVLFTIAPALVYVGWYAGWGRVPASAPVTLDAMGVFSMAAYVYVGLSSALTGFVGLPAGALLVVLVVFMLGFLPPPPRLTGTVALAIGAPLLFLLTGVGRVGFGIGQAGAPRYVYLAGALLLPVLGWSATALAGSNRVRRAMTAVALVACLSFNAALLVHRSGEEAEREHAIRRQLVAAVDLARSGESLISEAPEPRWTPDLVLDELLALAEEERFAVADPVLPAARLQARAALQVSVTAAPPRIPGRVEYEQAGTVRALNGCVSVHPAASTVVTSRGPSPFAVQIRADEPMVVRVVFTDRETDANATREIGLAGGDQRTLTVAATSVEAQVHIPAGAVELCG